VVFIEMGERILQREVQMLVHAYDARPCLQQMLAYV
jgi:hypothetical protein